MGARYSITGLTADQVRSIGGTDIREARSAGIVFATLTEAQVARIKALGGQVTEVGKVSAPVMPIVTPPKLIAAVPTYTPEQLTWVAGLEDLRQRLFKPPLYGEGFNLAIVDSGIRETHEKVKGRVGYRQNFTADPMMDGYGHGTGVASIAVAVAPLCNILNIKVLDSRGQGSEEDVVMGIDHVISLLDTSPELAPHVINLSLGNPDDGNANNPLRVACRAAIAKGIWVSAAAGNSGPDPDTMMSPACEKYVFATGSARYEPAGRSFSLSTWSSRGPTREGLIKPDAVFFGEDIMVASSGSDTATIAKSGTSFSTPFNSGIAILYHEGVLRYHGIQYPSGVPPGLHPEMTWLITIEELVDKYLQGICVKPQGAPVGKDDNYGYGMPFGSLVEQAIGVTPGIDLSAVLSAFVGVAMIGMVVREMR